jgi:hypothetical protein
MNVLFSYKISLFNLKERSATYITKNSREAEKYRDQPKHLYTPQGREDNFPDCLS